MLRTHPPRVMVGLLAVLLVASSARAEDEKVAWLESVAEAKTAAAESGRLILVYLDPGWTRGARTGSRASLADAVLQQLAEQVLVVRLPATIDDPESEAVRGRYALLNDLSGAVVIDADGARFWGDVAYNPDIVHAGVAKSPAEAKHYVEQQRVLADRPDRDSRLELARLYVKHHAFERAAQLLAALDEIAPLACEDRASLARALRITGDRKGAASQHERAAATGEDHAQRIHWRIARATIDVPMTRTAMLRFGREDPEIRRQGEAALRRLLAEVQDEGDTSAEAAVRLWLLHYVLAYAEHVAQPDWIVRNDPQGMYAIDSWVRLMEMAIDWNDIAAAKRHAEAAIAAHPENEQVVPWLKNGMLPSFDKILATPEDPAKAPFLLEASVDSGDGETGNELLLRVVVTNRSKRELRDVAINCHLSGPAAFLAQPVGKIPRFEPETVYELQFPLKRTGPGPIHLVVLLGRTSAGEDLTERGTHLRINSAE